MASSAMDIVVRDDGSIVLLIPNTLHGEIWLRQHLPEDAPMLGTSYAVESRYVGDILDGAIDDGLRVAL